MSAISSTQDNLAVPRSRRFARSGRKRVLLFILLVAPVILLRFSTAAWPILQTVRLSLTNQSVLAGTNDFVGLLNFRNMATDFGVRGAVSFTLIYVVATTVLDLVVGMAIALLLNASFRGRGFLRTINLLPWAVPTIVAGYVFRWLLDDQFGLIPYWYNLVTGDRLVVFISVWGARTAVILVQVWKDAPFIAIVLLAGLQGVGQDIYEAATVDGANGAQRFWRITVPLVLPLVITMGMFRLIWSLATFDLVYGLTFGGPGVATSVLALRVFQEGILFFKFGFASAIAVLLLLLVGFIGVLGLTLFRRTDVAY